ncbi:unnamed protein product [Candidula unifasciata]|uniref:Temptin Cys/Cys disulfide domain-containing protein n=1 Tax=Candidula unifasciata TaxID=100452 RepID=A0A8S3ZWW1_9EUPU|nr:unnamed protein product [Candidula unifasciata]
MKTTLCLMLTLTTVAAFGSFQSLIPNGAKVPDPCSTTGGLWSGVGHLVPGGGGLRNPFGSDFQLAGHAWNEILCKKDSDGDGKTNGEELGDPECGWSTTNGASLETPTGQPGICEPIGSPTCASQNFACPTVV